MRRGFLASMAAFSLLAGAAQAATLGRGAGGTMATYTADPGESNALTVSSAAVITSSVAMGVAGGSNCATSDPHQGACPGATSVGLALGDADDNADVRNGVADSVDCGPGNDRVTADVADAVSGCEEINLPPTPPAAVDADGDGALSTIDCNDTNPGVRPGASEIPGNAVDENCDGVAEPFPTLTVSVATKWLVLATSTRVTELKVTAPSGAKVKVGCTGKGCPFKSKLQTVAKGHATLTALFKTAKLKAGSVIELRVTSPGAIGKRYRWLIAKKKVPKATVTPLPPGA